MTGYLHVKTACSFLRVLMDCALSVVGQPINFVLLGGTVRETKRTILTKCTRWSQSKRDSFAVSKITHDLQLLVHLLNSTVMFRRGCVSCMSAGCRTDEAEAASASSKARTQRRHARTEAGRCLLGACQGRKDGGARKREASDAEGCCDFVFYYCVEFEITCR